MSLDPSPEEGSQKRDSRTPMMRLAGPSNLLVLAATLGIIALVGVFLSQWRNVLVPIVFAFLIWFLINAIASGLQRLPFSRFFLPNWLALTVSILLIFAGIYTAGRIIAASVTRFVQNPPDLASRLNPIVERYAPVFGFEDTSTITSLLSQIVNFSDLGLATASTTAGLAVNFLIVSLYVLLLLFEQHLIPYKMRALFGEGGQRKKAEETLSRIASKVQTYVFVKTIVSLITAVTSYFVINFFDVSHAIFWAFLIFLLNYIPNIGSTIAVILPTITLLGETDQLWQVAALFVSLVVIQQILGSIVDPRLMGESLNLSPFVVLVSLAVWGSMWGLAGMFICVPMTVVATIIMAEFPYTRPIAVVLTRAGNVDL